MTLKIIVAHESVLRKRRIGALIVLDFSAQSTAYHYKYGHAFLRANTRVQNLDSSTSLKSRTFKSSESHLKGLRHVHSRFIIAEKVKKCEQFFKFKVKQKCTNKYLQENLLELYAMNLHQKHSVHRAVN